MAKRIISELMLEEISVVTDPAQEPALIAIMKSSKPIEEEISSEEDLDNNNIENEEEDEITMFKDSIDYWKLLAALTDVEKAYCLNLDDAGQEAFLKSNANDRANEMKKAADSNPVVYKSRDGVEYRKNDDSRLIALAKKNDELAAAADAFNLAKREKEIADIIEKYKSLPGDVDTVKELITAVYKSDKSKDIYDLIAKWKELFDEGFEMVGVSDDDNSDADTEDAFYKARDAFKKQNPSIKTDAEATAKFLETSEGAVLYRKIYS